MVREGNGRAIFLDRRIDWRRCLHKCGRNDQIDEHFNPTLASALSLKVFTAAGSNFPSREAAGFRCLTGDGFKSSLG